MRTLARDRGHASGRVAVAKVESEVGSTRRGLA